MENKNKRANQNDRISELPDGITGLILSRLDMKEAARTSVLSHSWRYLWRLFFSGCLDFEAKETGCADDAKKFRDWVYKVIYALEDSPTVEQLRIAFPLNFFYAQDITKWIDFAIVKRVQKLELDLTCSSAGSSSNCSAYPFPSWLLDIPLDSPSFDRLTTLCLKSVSIWDVDLAYFLSTCSLLEQLLVEDASHLQNVRVSGQSLKLKHLEIRYCRRLENIEISSTSLVSFAYARSKINISFDNVPRLSSISLWMDCCEKFVRDFHSNLYFSQLQKLELHMNWLERGRCLGFPRTFPEFSNLKQLELKFMAFVEESHLFLTSIIGASPCLQILKLKYRKNLSNRYLPPEVPALWTRLLAPREKTWEEQARTYSHRCLKIVEFVGWVGRKIDVELANYFLETAVSLEKIILDLRIPIIFGKSWIGKGDGEALQSAMQLKRNLPPGMLIIHE